MKIIIPMSGTGSRFAQAGYTDLKPLIKVDGKPMIEWIVGMFPGESDFTFICREDHLQTTTMKETLNRIKPEATIVSIRPHKLGPVHALIESFATIAEDAPCLVSYCDYYMQWNYAHFKTQVMSNEYDGAVPCYTGFHPHLIPSKNVYAGCLVDSNKRLVQIQEKHSFEVDKTKGYHSPGVYFFKSGEILKKYCHQIVKENFSLNGEFYVSMIYDLMLRDQKNILVYDQISHFCQWGTPEDLEEFNFWISAIRRQG